VDEEDWGFDALEEVDGWFAALPGSAVAGDVPGPCLEVTAE
jgi:hypothetical protein